MLITYLIIMLNHWFTKCGNIKFQEPTSMYLE